VNGQPDHTLITAAWRGDKGWSDPKLRRGRENGKTL